LGLKNVRQKVPGPPSRSAVPQRMGNHSNSRNKLEKTAPRPIPKKRKRKSESGNHWGGERVVKKGQEGQNKARIKDNQKKLGALDGTGRQTEFSKKFKRGTNLLMGKKNNESGLPS